MKRIGLMRLLTCGCALLALASPAAAQIELSGVYSTRMYEDYIERGPGEFMGNFSGMPLSDEGRAKALLYTSNLPSVYERQCLAQSTAVFQYRPGGLEIWSELAEDGSWPAGHAEAMRARLGETADSPLDVPGVRSAAALLEHSRTYQQQ